MQYLINLMHLIPKNLISFLVGLITRIPWPNPLGSFIHYMFVKLFGVNMEEAEMKLECYPTIEDIFARRLAEGARPIESEVVSPSDGFLSISSATRADRAIQAKGLNYSLEELVFGHDNPKDQKFDPVWATTVYLAPHNYHRVHAPISGRLHRITYHPGELWPVNNPFVKHLPNMFTRNERLVFTLEWKPNVYVHAVMVGALNVGRMITPHVPSFVSNSAKRFLAKGPAILLEDSQTRIQAGDELGTFLLGSTVVLVFDRDFVAENDLREVLGSGKKSAIKMGESLLQ